MNRRLGATVSIDDLESVLGSAVTEHRVLLRGEFAGPEDFLGRGPAGYPSVIGRLITGGPALKDFRELEIVGERRYLEGIQRFLHRSPGVIPRRWSGSDVVVDVIPRYFRGRIQLELRRILESHREGCWTRARRAEERSLSTRPRRRPKGISDQRSLDWSRRTPVRRVAVITFPESKALRDVKGEFDRLPSGQIEVRYLTDIGRQSGKTPESIAQAIAGASSDCDVILLARGGGTTTEMWSFHTATVAQAILDSKAPVITALGHADDVTLADRVADLSCPVPASGARAVARAVFAGRADERSAAARARERVECARREEEAAAREQDLRSARSQLREMQSALMQSEWARRADGEASDQTRRLAVSAARSEMHAAYAAVVLSGIAAWIAATGLLNATVEPDLVGTGLAAAIVAAFALGACGFSRRCAQKSRAPAGKWCRTDLMRK